MQQVGGGQFCSVIILIDDLNILFIENSIESEVLLTAKETTMWLLDSGALHHVTPHRSRFNIIQLGILTQFELDTLNIVQKS